VIALNDFQSLFHHPLLLIQKKLTGFSFGNNGLQLIEGFLGRVLVLLNQHLDKVDHALHG
jgi:hypothetical protein